jgi:hypothetical protein
MQPPGIYNVSHTNFISTYASYLELSSHGKMKLWNNGRGRMHGTFHALPFELNINLVAEE